MDKWLNSPLRAVGNANGGNELWQGENPVTVPVTVPVTGESRKSTVSGGSKPAPEDAELAVVNAAWPTLPEAIRAGILAMVKAAGG